MEHSSINLEPELRATEDVHEIWVTMDLVLSVDTIQLHLYGVGAHMDTDMQQHGIARFALTNNKVCYKSTSDGASEAQFILKSLTMCNTEPENTQFREIIPATHHDRNQFMVLFSTAGGLDGASLAVVTIDSPQIIFSIRPLFALLDFFTTETYSDAWTVDERNHAVKSSSVQSRKELDFRLDLHDVAICVLENDQDPNTQAIKLNIQQLLISQQVSSCMVSLLSVTIIQGITALKADQLGMSLIQMGEKTETVRFLDGFDFTLSSDSRSSVSQQMINLELSARPVIVRASYRDISLITRILNKAFERFGSPGGSSIRCVEPTETKNSQKATTLSRSTRPKTIGKASVRMTKQQVRL